MPVTVPLLSRRPGTPRTGRRSVATRVVAASTAIGASLGVLAGCTEENSTEALHSPQLVAGTTDATFAAFTPPEAQRAQTVPEAVAWEQNRLAIEFARPKTIRPVAGPMSSTFGMRWGAMHAGIDFADPMGAPIAAVTDGVVIEAGPASGFGLWVRVQQDDGTIGVYGHMQDILVTVGQPVRAGDVIATVGSRGYSTGPHLHYEVHVPGVGPIDPQPWLAARGISVHGDHS
ncbi:M23 family metallopeptidase [Nocardia cyriacigeorgica]|uniref:M23 family metallopeptidase n=1 Tax=Nocardia cyriacigeorgica TaxID=135487 RepID=UPI001E510F91|nr:M23 family metallopeptidase [Nocardia cyriacigeorgica]